MATKSTAQKDWATYTDGQQAMECSGGPYDRMGFYVEDFKMRQRAARRMGYTGEDKGGTSLRYRPNGKTKQSGLRDFQDNPDAQVEVWVYADQPDRL